MHVCMAVNAGGGLVDEEGRTKKEFYEYIAASYRHFLAGDDARCSQTMELPLVATCALHLWKEHGIGANLGVVSMRLPSPTSVV
jgi:hypothetical protein